MGTSYRDIGALYAASPFSERLYARVRYLSAPLEKVAELVPPGATSLVELGCSNGVFANVIKTRYPRMDVTGIDLDPRKIAAARRTLAGRTGVDFVHAYAEDYIRDHPPPDVVAVVDMLYLLEPAAQDKILADIAAWLSPGGVIILKEMTDAPAWKRRWCEFQEWLAVKVVHLTTGSGIHLRPAADYRRALATAGMDVASFDLGRGYPHPHFAWRAGKPRK